MAIGFHTDGTAMPAFRKMPVKRWIKSIVERHGKTVGFITYVFCSDEKILGINTEFLRHDYYTDIITFDYSEENEISGDLFISPDTVRSNSEKFNTAFQDELFRVMIHGILHLCGFGDKSEAEQLRMREAENAALHLYKETFN
ncbi:MAG: rRNA maturation RNase YbeY [Tannerella sp.]|jgi:rRNA maturation RNase YbeY|nr:rRNA maturation RNase YbeY [Tannerella sp.]